jgi:hypothetical protein
MHRPWTIALIWLAGLASAEDLLKPVGGAGAGPTIDGLQASIRAVKEDFGPGESILIHWRLNNSARENKVVKLPADLRFPHFFDFEITRDGQAVTARMNPIDGVTVEKTLRGEGQFDSWIDLRALPWKDATWLDRFGPYEICVSYSGAGRPLPSGKATFRIVAANTPTFPKLDPVLTEQVKTLITRLGADDFAVREEAQKKLLEMGEKALGPLTEALTAAEDPEIRLRCRNLIDRIRQDRHNVPASEVLCERCRGMAFTADIGPCRQCQNHTPSGGWIYCLDCARRLNRCAACAQMMNVPIPAPQPEPIPMPRQIPPPVPVPLPAPVPPPAPPPEPVPPPRPPTDDF